MKIRPKIPIFQGGGRPFYLKSDSFLTNEADLNYYDNLVKGLVNGTILNNGLTLNKNRNNIYFNGDWNNYHNWHSQNIVIPWLNKIKPTTSSTTDWENLILRTLDSWNSAGGFQWLNATPELRLHGMQSNNTKLHLDMYYDDPLLKEEDDIIGLNSSFYNIPKNANSGDRFINGVRVGNNGQHSDTDFGIQTGNRRPTIHINTDENTTKLWDDYFRNLGYVGKYKYLDHWVPTKDINNASVKFINTPINEGEPSGVVVTPEKKKTQIPVDGNKTYGFDWNKLKEAGQKIFGNPDLYATGRLVGNLINNNRVYDELLKGIKPTLRQTYNTYRQVLGDEATKQAYYRRAVLGETKAARPFTSDADRLMAYLFEAKRVGDELRSQGDLADNQEIRRTSDESNQHLWANIQRATEVANANTASIDQANAEKHKLLAQKHSAQWSSIDNFLQGLEYRKRQQMAEDLDLEDKLYMLDLEDFLYTPEYAKAYEKYNSILEKHKKADNTYDIYNPEVIKARAEFLNVIKEFKKKQLQDYLEYKRNRNSFTGFLKQGSKITRKKKDDLLYKSTKDVVEHFRKMSKMSSDALNRKLPKIEKLTSHPKGKTKKYQLGGVAPFTIYKPIALGGETTTTTSSLDTSSSTNKSSSDKETLDLVKSLFKELLGKGLPVDVNLIYSQMNNLFTKQKAFGTELDTSDLALMYLQSMLSLSNAMYSKEEYDKAKALATLNEALDEFAVNALGHFIVLDTNTGKLSTEKSWKDVLASGKNPITNSQLLLMRAYNPDLASYKGDNIIGNFISSGMGINKIAAQIKTLAGNIGSYEGKIEGLTQVESNKVKQGLQLLANAPDGYYKHTVEDKNQLTQIKAAIAYITNALSPSQRAILDTHGGADKLIPLFLASQENVTHNVTFLPLTGKASDKNNSDDNGDKNMLPSVAFFNGLGEKDTFIILDKTSDGLKIDTISTTITSKGHNTGSITFDKLESSDFGGQLIMNLATMGDSLISSTGRNNIIIDGRIYQTELPIDLEAKRTTGIIKPDLRFLKNIEKVDSIIKLKGLDKSNPKDIPMINKIYQENSLPILYTISNNKPTITSEYARFAILNGIGTEDAFGEKPQFNNGVLEVSSDKERQLFESMMLQQGNSKYKLDNGVGIGSWTWGETKLYKGTIYIPMTTNNISALAGTGFKAKGEEYNLIEAKQQAADAAREKGFNPAGDVSNLL